LSAASAQLRNLATTAGNILQRSRCVYFRSTDWPCNRRVGGSGCSAVDGETRTHAILGVSDHCLATHASDMCVALAALDAAVSVTGPEGGRVIPFAEFHRLPGDTPERENALELGEVITSISIPATPVARRSTYLKIRERSSNTSGNEFCSIGLFELARS
jgi:xanthine dehydrogenase YagS FAD-binding subunit